MNGCTIRHFVYTCRFSVCPFVLYKNLNLMEEENKKKVAMFNYFFCKGMKSVKKNIS